MRVALLYGGISEEREVSCQSAAAVAASIDRETHELLLIAVDSHGRWYLQPPQLLEEVHKELPIHSMPSQQLSLMPGAGLWRKETNLEIEMVFSLLHGRQGEDGLLQGALEIAHLPYVGSGVCASAVGMHKVLTRQLWEQAALPVVPYIDFGYQQVVDAIPRSVVETTEIFVAQHGFPLFVKPSRSGSSAGISKLHSLNNLKEALEKASRYDHHLLVEKGIEGAEMEYAVIGNEAPRISVGGQIVSNHEFYDYTAKYLDTEGSQLVVPAEIPTALDQKIRTIVQQAYTVCEAGGLARIELFLDSKAHIYLNEINTIPGFTSHSIFPNLWKAEDYSMRDIIEELFCYAIEQHRRGQRGNQLPIPS